MSGDPRPEDWRPGDHIVQIWPSDEWVNVSRDARAMAAESSAVFRAELDRRAMLEQRS